MATTRDLTAANEAWVLINQLWWAEKKRFHALCTAYELSGPQVMALRHLEPGKPSTMRGLADRLHCDNSNVTGIVDRLEKRDLVTREAAEHDRRVKHLVLTAAGEQLRAEILERADRAPEALHQLSDVEQQQLRDLLRRCCCDGSE